MMRMQGVACTGKTSGQKGMHECDIFILEISTMPERKSLDGRCYPLP